MARRGRQCTIGSIIISLQVILLCLGMGRQVYGQSVTARLNHPDSVALTIMRVAPDSFPAVSMIFKAEKGNGEPLWNLERAQLAIVENGQPCDIVSLSRISENQSINLSLVVDHSGSMAIDQSLLFDAYGNPKFRFSLYTGNLILPKNYSVPMENARKAVKKFARGFDFRKDFISMVGFSTHVDNVLTRTQSADSIASFVDGLEADGLTALYDAMMTGLNELNDNTAVNVLVALTDGQNNSSVSRWQEIVAAAREKQIPLYIIGLGDVRADTLKMMAEATGGQFYYIRHSSSLDSIYTSLRKKIQACYSVTYTSPNLASVDTLRESILLVSVDSQHNVMAKHPLALPANVVARLHLAEERKQNTALAGGGITVVAAGLLAFFVIRRRKKKQAAVEESSVSA